MNTSLRPCPESYSKYCYNEGTCYATFAGYGRNFRPICRCAKDFHGPHCEYLFNPDVYGFAVSEEIENKALSTLAIILFLVIIGLIWCLILQRGYRMYSNRMTSQLDGISSNEV
ncbi:EGF-like domain-containing protein [Meloidogyne graminicola]|uniref:EGF-like domain-containing protein n=1 Tax=Meloidogyne graminicola TaxID=189291 RepID=A0A8T0A4I3_9BILA|nr:EGF-like domain-containing protein [Meloidogyne graminicola]